MDIPLEEFLNGMKGIYTKKYGGCVEWMGVKEDAFAGFVLRQWPFFEREALRRVGFLEMVEIVDATSAEGVVRMVFH